MATDSRHCSFRQFQQGGFQIYYATVRSHTEKVLRETLEKGWGICKAEDISRQKCEMDTVSNSFRVSADGKRYLLKGTYSTAPRVLEEANRCLLFCREAGLRAPFVVFTTEGKPCYRCGRQMFSLYEFIDGEHFDGSRKELRETAAALGELDAALSKAPCESAIRSAKGPRLCHDRGEAEAIFSQIRGRGVKNNFERMVMRWLGYIEEKSRALSSFDFNSLPLQLTHTNIHPHNLLFSKETQALLAFVGFDAVYFSQRVRGVAYTMHRLSRTYGKDTEAGADIGEDIRVRAKEFLKSYSSSNPLRIEELNALRAILEDEALCRVLTLLRRHYLRSRFDKDEDLEKRLTFLRETDLFDFL